MSSKKEKPPKAPVIKREAIQSDYCDSPISECIMLGNDSIKARAEESRKLASRWAAGEPLVLPVFHEGKGDRPFTAKGDREWALAELRRIDSALKELATPVSMDPWLRAPGLFCLISGAIETMVLANGLAYEKSAEGLVLPEGESRQGMVVREDDMALQLAAAGLMRKVRSGGLALGRKDERQLRSLEYRSRKMLRRYHKQVAGLAGKRGRANLKWLALLIGALSLLTALGIIVLALVYKHKTLSISNPVAEISKPPGKAGGIIGRYYRNKYLEGRALRRVDRTINFNWRRKVPLAGMPTDKFSIQWRGFLRIEKKGRYTLCTRSDDGVRLLIGAHEIIDNWTIHSKARDCQTILFEKAGWYPLDLQFFDENRDAEIKLLWAQKGNRPKPVPRRALCCSNR